MVTRRLLCRHFERRKTFPNCFCLSVDPSYKHRIVNSCPRVRMGLTGRSCAQANLLSEQHQMRTWYALYTRPRSEKKVEQELTRRGLRSYLPLRSQIRFWSDRKKKVKEPLFPSYVFVWVSPKERLNSLQTPGVVRMVGFDGTPAAIPESQIEAVRLIVQNDVPVQEHTYVPNGTLVEVASGVLKGVRGFVMEQRKQNNVVVSIKALKHSVAVTIPTSSLRCVDTSEASKEYEKGVS